MGAHTLGDAAAKDGRTGTPQRGAPCPPKCRHSGQPIRPGGGGQGRCWGYDASKKITGRKRQLLVDTLGLILAIVITAARVQDRYGGLFT